MHVQDPSKDTTLLTVTAHERHGFSNYRRLNCLLNAFYGLTSRKTSRTMLQTLLWPVDFPHIKGQWHRKHFPAMACLSPLCQQVQCRSQCRHVSVGMTVFIKHFAQLCCDQKMIFKMSYEISRHYIFFYKTPNSQEAWLASRIHSERCHYRCLSNRYLMMISISYK